jgi:WD40 repeat protein
VVSSSRDNTLKVWDMRKRNRCLFTLQDHRDWVKCFQFDSKRLVSGSYDHTIKVWDMKTGRCTRTLTGHTGAVNSVRYDADAVTLVSGSADRTLRLWQLKTGDCLRTYEGHTGEVETFAIADGRMYSGANDGAICTWALDDASPVVKPQFTLAGSHTDAVVVLQPLPSGELDGGALNDSGRKQTFGRIVSGSADGTCKLWRFLGSPTIALADAGSSGAPIAAGSTTATTATSSSAAAAAAATAAASGGGGVSPALDRKASGGGKSKGATKTSSFLSPR